MKRSVSRILVSVVSASMLLSGSAFAQKDSKKKGDAKAAATAGAAPAKKDKKEEKKGPSAKFKNAPKLEDSAKEALADKKRDEEIDQLKKIITKFEAGSPQKADLLFQLSELYWDKSKYVNRQEVKKFQEEEKKVDEARNRGEKVADAKPNYRESEMLRGETVRLYQLVLTEYPAYERKDEVLFALGYNLYEQDKKKEAIARFKELIKNYPQSKFISDTYVQLGNHYFDVEGNLAEAKNNFEKALASKDPNIYSYSLYKLAWCDFNAGVLDGGLKKMQDVVEYADKHKVGDLKTEALNDMVIFFVQLNVPDSAVKYFKEKAPKKRQVRLIGRTADGLAGAGHHESAIKVYRTLLNDAPTDANAPEYQQAIVKSYEGLRQREQVKAEIRKLAELYSPGSLWWKANESKKDVLRNAFNVAEEAMRTVVTEYHQEAQKTKAVATYRLARDIYKQYVDAFASSSDENFVADQAFNLSYYYADILWSLEEWEPAAEQYTKVVNFKIPARDTAKEVANEKYRQDSAYAAMIAYSKLVKIERGELAVTKLDENKKIDEKAKKDKVERKGKIEKRKPSEMVEKPLTKFESKLTAACDSYNTLYPNNQDEIDVRYQAAVVYYDKNHFVEAARRFGEIINKFPEEKRSREAADLSMYVLEEKEEWLELNKLARQFVANKRLGKGDNEFTKRVATVVEGSQYKWVDEVVYKKEKNPAKAAEEFIKFVAEFPQSQNADRALTYSMIIFQEASQIDRGIESGERVLKEYPGSVFELKVLYALGKFYEQTADFAKSAKRYEDFVAAYDRWTNNADLPKDLQEKMKKDAADAAKLAKGKAAKGKPAGKDAAVAKSNRVINEEEKKAQIAEAKKLVADAMFNQGLWYEGLGQTDKATAAYQAYMARFKDAKDVPTLHYNIALILEKEKKTDLAIKQYESFNTTFAKDARTKPSTHYVAKYKQLQLHKSLKNFKEVEALQNDLIKSYAKLPEAEKKDVDVLNGYGHARFLSLEPMWASYTGIKLAKVGTLKKDLQAKQKKIIEVEKAYTDVLAIGAGEWGIAALSRIGLAYADFAQNILDSPDPKGLDDEQLELYRGELENLAFPLEEKAIEALEKATGKAYELNIYNEWTLAAQDKINKYRPGYYAKVKEVSFQGSEFFQDSPIVKESGILAEAAPAPAPAPAPVAPANDTPAPPASGAAPASQPPTAGGPQAGAGAR